MRKIPLLKSETGSAWRSSTGWCAVLARVVVALCAAACDDRNIHGPEHYFADHKCGDSPDFGVFMYGTDHVISVHGFAYDDMKICLQIADVLNKEDPTKNYACKPLNH